MKKLEEQESAVNVACPMEDEASWVITCKGDHEEEITSTFLSTIDNVKI